MPVSIAQPLALEGARIPERPAGLPMVVRLTHRPVGVGLGLRFFEVVDDSDTGDGLVRLAPLTSGDDRDPFWYSAADLIEVPGAYLGEDGFLRIPTNQIDDLL